MNMYQGEKIQFKLVRSFSIGFTIYSYKLNGLVFDINIFCFSVLFAPFKGRKLVSFDSYWERKF